MKKILSAVAMVAIAMLMTACGGGNTPKGVADAYSQAIIKGDYRTAFDYVYFGDDQEKAEKTKEQMLSYVEEKVKSGIPDERKMTEFEITDEQIDEEAGKATVTANVTYANGTTKVEEVPLVKTADGKWMVESGK